ncbi:MAG: hypothetical protein K2R93_19070 [Gemmatimonadaceae bacterium]|nr:hypothetical protein [Gemmatimonadaceae bacterium]
MTLTKLTIPALLAQWARIVDDVERTAGITAGARRDDPQHDPLADADVRHELATRIRVRPLTTETREMLLELDALYRAATVPVETCIRGAELAAQQGWTPQREWYYWRVPKTA